jgi:2-hydroxy-3-keto-5-methylthiopentenyl-1-phosphate phosphatase
MLPHDVALLHAVAAEIPLDPYLDALIARMAVLGVEATVVSDGFGFWAEHVIAGRLPVITNRIVGDRLTFPHQNPTCPCDSCGVCKPAVVLAARSRGRTTVVIGDGTSDIRAAAVADVVFAKDSLAQWCRDHDRPHVPFTDLGDVLAAMSEPLERLRHLTDTKEISTACRDS